MTGTAAVLIFLLLLSAALAAVAVLNSRIYRSRKKERYEEER